MGGLRKSMPLTYRTFMAGTLALCGIPPLSGFYSKDGILAQALEHNVGLFVIGLFGVVLTTFYMFRLVLVVFYGAEKSEAAGHAHESPSILAWPLMVLAVPSVIGGFLGIEGVFAKYFEPGKAVEAAGMAHQALEPFSSPLAAFFGLFAILIGLALSLALYRRVETDPLPEKLGWLSRAMRNRFYFDELYERVLIPCTQEAAAKLADALDRWLIGGVVRGVHGTTELAGRALRLFQTGSIQDYAFLLVLGLAVVLFFVLAR
jgi:NADH-quinone oxidoreductase subunit L